MLRSVNAPWVSLVGQTVPEPSRREEAVGIKLVVQRIDGDGFARAGCVHELVLADVDADVIDLATADPEEHQVAATEFARLDALGFVGLFRTTRPE